ncbi:acetylornithine deacetylase [Aequitasia blattaphilus]|uniref:ArgE/DapE family deacylase n=1 Tax=Aequitasia blattaphilus TaxID=2949332 RepID=A0ABT1E7Y2_9FIRM|nr:ArgE/DapE family deacylase [Aequitasia blattaphilus]MCP1101935.1 ArgE/DapE family deacylase [Aequitasia blattaphilus]MCR8614575.1 ArgE/DapE family deacylase [Aequitasia blattaphilus]
MNLKEVLEQNKEEYIQELLELLSIDTHDIGHGIKGGLEKEGQEYLIQRMESMGADEIICDSLKEEDIKKSLILHNEGNVGHDLTNRFNVYGRFKGNKPGKSLLFNSHMDVMPANEDEWDYPPFKGTVEDGRIYGRGAADMKGGLMASLMAVKLLKDAKVSFPGEVIITSVCDEEGGGNGSIQAVMSGMTADAVVNCEPSNEELILAHMGWVFFRVEFEGKACHSGTKNDGVSAIDKALKVIEALNEKEHHWLLTYKHPLLPAPNLNIGVLKGGTEGSTVPGKCVFETCVHYVPGLMSHEQVVKEFEDVVYRTARADEWMEKHLPKITLYQQGNGFEMEKNHPFVKSFHKVYQEVKEEQVKMVGSPSGCDSRLWRNIAKLPTIQFGPGTLEACHAVNESIEVRDYLQSILIYAELILEWCQNKEEN